MQNYHIFPEFSGNQDSEQLLLLNLRAQDIYSDGGQGFLWTGIRYSQEPSGREKL